MIIVGDIHENIKLMKEIIADHPGEDIIQVGDLGVGDNPLLDEQFKNLSYMHPYFRFIRGNHDSKSRLSSFRGFIPDGTILDTNIGPMLCVGGAFSVDKARRLDYGRKVWPDEEITHSEYYEIYETCRNVKPAIILSHDGPQTVVKNAWGYGEVTKTRNFLESLNLLANPQLHIFGHHHLDLDVTERSTRYICVGLDKFIHLPDIRLVNS